MIHWHLKSFSISFTQFRAQIKKLLFTTRICRHGHTYCLLPPVKPPNLVTLFSATAHSPRLIPHPHRPPPREPIASRFSVDCKPRLKNNPKNLLRLLVRNQRAAKGVENSGGWKTYWKFGVKRLPKNVFGPPTYDTFPPPFFGDSLSFLLKERGTDQTNPNF